MSEKRKLRVAVLMGGTSSERPVSLSTGKMILSTLDPERYEVAAIDTQELIALPGGNPSLPSPEGEGALPLPLLRKEGSESSLPSGRAGVGHALQGRGDAANDLVSAKPDVVFIALHGKGGEDGTIQGMLELMGLPYTGSGVLASALAMDKAKTKRLFRSEGLPVLKEIQVRRGESLAGLDARVCAELGHYPVFVKPNAEGSTFGCNLVQSQETLEAAVSNALKYDPVALIEPYVRGMEITCGVLGNAGETLESLPIIEIVPKSEYYDYESKYADGGSEHIIPARLSEEVTRRAQEIALQCHELLGCKGMSRTDMIACGDTLWILEVNTIPGMTPTSLLPQAAAHIGISFADLLDRIIASALPRTEEYPSHG